jgi:hypothetical protein
VLLVLAGVLNLPEVEGLGWRKATSAVGELLVEKNTKGMDVVYAIGGNF